MRAEVNKKFADFKSYIIIICNIANGGIMFLCELERRNWIITKEVEKKIKRFLDSISKVEGFDFIKRYREEKE